MFGACLSSFSGELCYVVPDVALESATITSRNILTIADNKALVGNMHPCYRAINERCTVSMECPNTQTVDMMIMGAIV